MTIKILLPVDGSDCALRAVGHLIAHTAWFRECPRFTCCMFSHRFRSVVPSRMSARRP